MRYQSLGTKLNFEEFLRIQAKAYLYMLTDHYGLPPPDEVKEPYIRVARLAETRVRVGHLPPPESVDVHYLEFRKNQFRIGDGPTAFMDIWVLT